MVQLVIHAPLCRTPLTRTQGLRSPSRQEQGLPAPPALPAMVTIVRLLLLIVALLATSGGSFRWLPTKHWLLLRLLRSSVRLVDRLLAVRRLLLLLLLPVHHIWRRKGEGVIAGLLHRMRLLLLLLHGRPRGRLRQRIGRMLRCMRGCRGRLQPRLPLSSILLLMLVLLRVEWFTWRPTEAKGTAGD